MNNDLAIAFETTNDHKVIFHESYSTRPTAAAKKGKAGADATTAAPPAIAKSDGKGSDRFKKWDTPKLILDKIEKVPIAARAIEDKAMLLLGQRLNYIKKSEYLKGNIVEFKSEEVENFLTANAIRTEYLPARAFDLVAMYNCFSQFIFNLNRTKILQLVHLEAEYSRVSKLTPAKGVFDRQYLYYSFLFSDRISDNDLDNPDKVVTLTLHDHSNLQFLNQFILKKGASFARQSRIRTPRSFYYATPTHIGAYKEGGLVDILDNANDVILNAQQNQMGLKFILFITHQFFELKFGKMEWRTQFTDQQKYDAFEETRKSLEEKLIGTKNVNSALTMLIDKPFGGNIEELIIIKPIDDKFKTGTWLPDVDHGNKQVLIAHGVPSSMYGLTNSNVKMNTESGSANREGFNQVVTMNTPQQEILLQDLQLVADFNNFDALFFVEDITHTTINQQETGIQKTEKKL